MSTLYSVKVHALAYIDSRVSCSPLYSILVTATTSLTSLTNNKRPTLVILSTPFILHRSSFSWSAVWTIHFLGICVVQRKADMFWLGPIHLAPSVSEQSEAGPALGLCPVQLSQPSCMPFSSPPPQPFDIQKEPTGGFLSSWYGIR